MQAAAVVAAALSAALVVMGSLAPVARGAAVARAGAAILLVVCCAGVGAHLEATLRGVRAPPPWAPVLGASFALLVWAAAGEDRPRWRSFGALSATALVVAAASLADHGRRGFAPLPWTALAPAAGLALMAAAAAAASPALRAARRLVGSAGAITLVVGTVGLVLHGGAAGRSLPGSPLLERLALPPPVLAPAAVCLLGLWAWFLAWDRGPVRVVWLRAPGQLSQKQEFSRRRPNP